MFIKRWIIQYQTNQNIKQYITLVSGFVTEFMSITISSLALWFIPQSIEYSPAIVITYSSNVWYVILLININFITWLCFGVLYILEVYRDIWLIRNFDYSKRYNSIHLARYKKDYPETFSILDKLNFIYYQLYRMIRIIVWFNVIFTCIIINLYNYGNYKTITTLFTNSLISFSKVQTGITIARDSLKNSAGYSYFNTVNMSYNRMDPRIKRHISHSNQPSIGTPRDLSNQNTPNDSPNNSLHNSLRNSLNGNSLNESFNGIQTNIENISNKDMPCNIMDFKEIDFMQDNTTIL